MKILLQVICSDNGIANTLIGVGGTLLGTILGWALNKLSSKGKLKTYVSNWTDEFKYNKTGFIVPSNSIELTEMYAYNLCLDIYNSSAEPKIMRNIRIVFSNGKNDIFISVPKEKRTLRGGNTISVYDNVAPLTILPKSILQIDLLKAEWREKDNDLFIWNVKKVFLEYIDGNNKKRRMLIKKENYSEYFENHLQEDTNDG